jgi:putative intracellular protease/amidase
MSAAIDITNPEKPKRIAIVASNPALSKQTGWPIGFWWAELTHPYYEFVEHGYQVDICSPDGGKLQGDGMSDPRDEGKLMADDLVSLGFIYSPQHSALLENSTPIGQVKVNDYDAILFVGGEGRCCAGWSTAEGQDTHATGRRQGTTRALLVDGHRMHQGGSRSR